MKAVLEFNLPEEQHEHQVALDGWRWRAVVSDIAENLRSTFKHDGTLTPETHAYLDEFREELFQLIADRNLNLYDE